MTRWADIRSSLTLVAGPSSEPVTRAQAKAWPNPPIDHTADDTLIDALITAARLRVEADLGGYTFGTQSFSLSADAFPGEARLTLPRWPLSSSNLTITSYDTDDTSSVFAASSYRIDTTSRPGRIVLNDGAAWPSDLRATDAVVIAFDAGATAPESYLHAVKMLVAHWYERDTRDDVPMGYAAMITDRLYVVA